ncbi:MAG TPA: 2,3-bisphosphoglycerate-independent phosphoglycerate mutase [Candidatus Limnocylindrales bacterium]|nr:2,3-bisphosphoglycerate-independent phosphoglycerate mutase [Candidatus Limnocylindrales bacterium]
MTSDRAMIGPAPRRPRPIVLVILDGFGIGSDPAADAIAAAPMPTWRGLLARWPNARLRAAEDAVGLPPGQMGNSEVGHLNLGAGRPVLQDLPRIDAAIADGSFFERPALVAACDRAATTDGRLHVVSLVGPGGVHANDRHLVALAELAARRGTRSVRVHALLDGRDTPPRSAIPFLVDLETRLAAAHPDARIATVGGRYYAMDRDRRWERTARGYDAIVHGVGERAASAVAAIERAYERGENDEFVLPTIVDGVDGRVRDGDPIVHANFRADRARQLSHALADPDFAAFDRDRAGPRPRDLFVVTMTSYEAGLPVAVAFPPEESRSLAHAASDAGWRQLHVAETEKYAHVTYFFNGGREVPLPGEDRQLVPSPKVATYDLQPAMSAAGVANALVAAIESETYDFIVANFANPDMVGHTGVWDATVAALGTVDACLARIVAALERVDGAAPGDAADGADGADAGAPGSLLVVTADHGNAEVMRDRDGKPVTAHSLNPVPIVLVGRAAAGRRLRDGVLADVAPTILELAGLQRWDGMTGTSLLEPADAGDRAGAGAAEVPLRRRGYSAEA